MPLSGYMPPGFADDDDPYQTRDANREAALEATRQTEYLAYLIRTGHPHEATWFLAETKAGSDVKALSSFASYGTLFALVPIFSLGLWWRLGQLLLVSIFWSLAFGAVAALTYRSQSVRAKAPLERPAQFGLFCAAVAPPSLFFVIAAMTSVRYEPINIVGVVVSASPLLLIALGLVRLKHGYTWREYARALRLVAIISVVVPMGIVAVCTSYNIAIVSVDRSLSYFLDAILTGGFGCGVDGSAPFILVWRTFFLIATPLAVGTPWGAAAVLAVASKRRGTPVSAGVIAGWPRVSLGVAGALLVCYAPILLATAGEEDRLRNELTAITTHEGRYLAQIAGKPWPGYVDLTAAGCPLSIPTRQLGR